MAGFNALTINRDGYPDHARLLINDLRPVLGKPNIVSDDLVWFDLRPLRLKVQKACGSLTAQKVGQMILHGAVGRIMNAKPPLQPQRPGIAQWFESTSTLQIVNPLQKDRDVNVAMTLRASVPSRISFDVSHRMHVFRIGPTPRTITFSVQLAPGTSNWRVSTDAPVDQNAPQLRPQLVASAAVQVEHMTIAEPVVENCLTQSEFQH